MTHDPSNMLSYGLNLLLSSGSPEQAVAAAEARGHGFTQSLRIEHYVLRVGIFVEGTAFRLAYREAKKQTSAFVGAPILHRPIFSDP